MQFQDVLPGQKFTYEDCEDVFLKLHTDQPNAVNLTIAQPSQVESFVAVKLVANTFVPERGKSQTTWSLFKTAKNLFLWKREGDGGRPVFRVTREKIPPIHQHGYNSVVDANIHAT